MIAYPASAEDRKKISQRQGEVSMELEILKNEEKRMNLVIFLFLAVIPCVAMG